MRRLQITTEHLEWLKARVLENSLNQSQLGVAFKEEFPGVFPKGTMARNVAIQLKRVASDQGFDIPHTSRHKVSQPMLRWLAANPELVIQYHPKIACVGDIHAGSHDPDVIEFIAEKIAERGIEALVWCGDIFDNAYIGHKGNHSAFAAPFDEVIGGAVEVWDRFRAAGVSRHYLYQGNHDNKPMRGTQGEWSFEAFLQTEFFPHVNLKGATVRTTNRYYITMKPRKPKGWPFKGPENFATRLTHQKEYSRIPLRAASRLASKLFMNVACNHQHHLGWTHHESGLVWLADTGCAQRVGATEYKDMRDSTHPEHINGFLTIEDGWPHAWSFKRR